MKHAQRIPRRDFIRKSALAGTALAGAGLLTSTQARANPRTPLVKSKDILKVGLIGCGGRGTGAAVQVLNAHESVRMVALADTFEDKVKRSLQLLKQEHPGKVDIPPERQFVGLDAYLGLIDEVDVVLHVTPPQFRPLHTEAAVKAGKHCFCEKPVAVDMAGCKKMMEVGKLAEEKGLVVNVGFDSRYDPRTKEHVKMIHEGAIGDIEMIRLYNYYGLVSWLKQYDRTPEMTEMEFQIRNWYFFNWLSGDIIVELAVHGVDRMCWVKDAYPVEAQGVGGRHVRTGPMAGDIFDHQAVEYTFADGSKGYLMSRQLPGTYTNTNTIVHGSKGSWERGKLNINGEVHVGQRDAIGRKQHEQNELINSVLEGKSRNELAYGVPSTIAAIMGREASYCGKVVTWEQAMNSNQSLWPPELSNEGYQYAMTWDTNPISMPLPDGTYPTAMPGITEAF